MAHPQIMQIMIPVESGEEDINKTTFARALCPTRGSCDATYSGEGCHLRQTHFVDIFSVSLSGVNSPICA